MKRRLLLVIVLGSFIAGISGCKPVLEKQDPVVIETAPAQATHGGNRDYDRGNRNP